MRQIELKVHVRVEEGTIFIWSTDKDAITDIWNKVYKRNGWNIYHYPNKSFNWKYLRFMYKAKSYYANPTP